MGKLILEGEPRKLRNLNGSLYMLVEQPQAKILGFTEESEVMASVYYSDKHDSYFLAGYEREEGGGEKIKPEEEGVIEGAMESHAKKPQPGNEPV